MPWPPASAETSGLDSCPTSPAYPQGRLFGLEVKQISVLYKEEGGRVQSAYSETSIW